jgi:hypothetical protein
MMTMMMLLSPRHCCPRSIHNKPVNALWEWTAVDTVPVEYAAFLPSTSCIKITLGAGVQVCGGHGAGLFVERHDWGMRRGTIRYATPDNGA